MSTRGKSGETSIIVTLDEPLTSNSCVKLVMELLKYILYQKQQIPFAYDSLAQLHTRSEPVDRNSSSIKALLNSLKTTAEHLSSQFHLRGCQMKEIAIIIGATIVSPKLHIRFELPPEILNSKEHFECKHSSRQYLLSLLRSMLECSEFQDAMTVPLNPTNTFILVHKSDSNSASEFFLPKPQFSPLLPSATSFCIKLCHNAETKAECNCVAIVKVYQEASESLSNENVDSEFLNVADMKLAQPPFAWYQAKEVIKGFTFFR